MEEDLIKIVPIAFDSMGARGMSSVVRVGGRTIVIDPGVNLAPRRHKLPPHPIEEEKKKTLWERIEYHAKEADSVILTHYHYDHLNPEGYDLFFGKTVYLKHPERDLNYNQRRRASILLREIEDDVKDIVFADGETVIHGDLNITFSPAVPHGMDTERGCVVQVCFRDDSGSFLYTSDIEGANLDEQINFIIENNPDVLLIDGPAITFPKCRTHRLSEIISETDVRKVIIDHHIMRESNWMDYIKDALQVAKEKGVDIFSAAKFKGEEENLLEAKRVELYEKFPVT